MQCDSRCCDFSLGLLVPFFIYGLQQRWWTISLPDGRITKCARHHPCSSTVWWTWIICCYCRLVLPVFWTWHKVTFCVCTREIFLKCVYVRDLESVWRNGITGRWCIEFQDVNIANAVITDCSRTSVDVKVWPRLNSFYRYGRGSLFLKHLDTK